MSDEKCVPAGPGRPAPEMESSLTLLHRAQKGERWAVDRLLERYLPRLQRWASGRLPGWARSMLETDDLVQETLLRTFQRIEAIEPRGDGALQAYMCQAVRNRIRDELRRVGRRPGHVAMVGDERDTRPSPLEETIGQSALASYEGALERLKDEEREAILMRVELDLGYKEIAAALGKPTADAARMTVSRALVRLAREMDNEQ